MIVMSQPDVEKEKVKGRRTPRRRNGGRIYF
jgi:hypothetical protein